VTVSSGRGPTEVTSLVCSRSTRSASRYHVVRVAQDMVDADDLRTLTTEPPAAPDG
jgi:hypothetical protein